MSRKPEDLNPKNMKELEDIKFLAYLEEQCRGSRIEPDEQDFDATVHASTETEAAEQYQLAAARKIMRSYREWKAGQN